MKTRLVRKTAGLFLTFVMGLVLLTACSSLPFKQPEVALQERIEKMMAAKVNNDWETVYDYLDASYRKKTPLRTFLGFNREMEFSDFSITSVDIDPSGKEATAVLEYDLRVKMFTFENRTETQQWVKEGFNWYLKVK